MRIKLLLIVAAAFSSFMAQAQNGHVRCATMQHMEDLKAADPTLEQRMKDDETLLEQEMARTQQSRTSNVVYTIPVVVHVVWRTTAQNISDAQVQSQIDVLNEDFGRYNADTVNTPAAFRSVASATQFQFCLATRDPNGNPTNGIERRQTTVTSFNTSDLMKSYATGGLDAWDVNRYLNIWVCNLSGGVLGYGEFPSTTRTNTFGVVVMFNCFGRVGTLNPTYNKGRTCTHEFSHCFRLYHIWGDDGGSCSGSDGVADTPNQAEENYGCPTFPMTDACSPNAPGIMFMNYMDYGDDRCLNMFTTGQASRMFSAINAFYRTLFSSNGCELVNSIGNEPNVSFNVYPNPTEGMISIDLFTSAVTTGLNVRVTDALGRVVKDEQINNPAEYVYNVDLSSNENGVYFVTVYNKSFSRTERVVLNR